MTATVTDPDPLILVSAGDACSIPSHARWFLQSF